MKLLIRLVLSCFALLKISTLNAQDISLPMSDNKVQYEIIDSTVTGSKDELYARAKKWFATSFRDSKSVLELDDKSAGTVLGKGYFSFNAGGLDYTFRTTFEVKLKDNKYRFKMFDFYNVDDKYDDRPVEFYYDRYKKGEMKKHFSKVFAAFVENVNKISNSLTKGMATKDDF